MEHLPVQVCEAICEYAILVYLVAKLILRQGGNKLERARDLFEQALEKCPPKSCKPIFLMYAKLEEEYGLAKRAMGIYERATQVVSDEDKFEVGAPYYNSLHDTNR